MSIRYSVDSQGFLMRDLGTGFGAFLRIEKPIEIA
jgi:hypothetical protein